MATENSPVLPDDVIVNDILPRLPVKPIGILPRFTRLFKFLQIKKPENSQALAVPHNSPELPEDVIVTGILPRLPVKSVGRFRCVSKQWRSLLSSPEFVIHNPPQCTIFEWKDSVHILNLVSETCTNTGWFGHQIVTSCNGLLLLSRPDGTEVLVNPITRESHKIPNFWPGCSGRFCLGYDSLNDDYKIVSLSTPPDCLVGIYSVRRKSWKRVLGCPYDHCKICNLPLQGSGVFLNGYIHWLVTDTGFMIASFSLGTEEFGILPPPGLDSLVRFHSAKLGVLGGCLTLTLDVQDKSIEVWVLKEYGVQDSWTKLTINHPRTKSRVLGLVCLFGDDEVLGILRKKDNSDQLVAYSVSNRGWRDVAVRSFSGSYFYNLTSFSESLVSPNY